MNRSLLVGLIVGAGATAAMGALANFAFKNDREALPPISATEQAGDAQLADTELPTAALPDDADAAASHESHVVQPVRKEPEFARVVNVQPLTRTVSEPREVCQEVEVVKQAPVRDEHQVAGTLIGGVIGGVIGNQIGDGDGRKIAKVAGAIGGAYAGNKVQERIQKSRTVTTMETKCETVYDSRVVPDGYRVTYEWNGRTQTVKMANKPGSQLPVRDGEVVLAAN